MKVLELGNYIIPAYAGMVLAEQGHEVVKFTNGRDPILGLQRGPELWAWINHGKVLRDDHPRTVLDGPAFDIILDNFRPTTLKAWGITPVELCQRFGYRWISMRPEVGDRSFDVLAQAQAWMEFCPYIPFYIGDTAPGLWMAFKALASTEPGAR